jgi:hypothetical protein
MPPGDKTMQPFEELLMTGAPDPELDQPETATASDVEAVFTLESVAVCPACQARLETVGIVRLLRTRVNFVSSLPRRGQLMVCPKCKTVLGGGLGGLV